MEASERASPEPRRSVQTGATCPPPPASSLGTVAGTSQRGRRRSRGHPASSQEAGRASRRLVTSCAVSRPRVVKPRSRAAVWRVFGDRALAWRCVGECQGGRASVVRGPRLPRRRAGAVVPGATPPPRAPAPAPHALLRVPVCGAWNSKTAAPRRAGLSESLNWQMLRLSFSFLPSP